jgi:hypothetical protein
MGQQQDLLSPGAKNLLSQTEQFCSSRQFHTCLYQQRLLRCPDGCQSFPGLESSTSPQKREMAVLFERGALK